MTLNLLVKMRTRSTQNVIFTPNAPYLLCSWRDKEGITSSWLRVWPKVNTDPITWMQRTEMLLASVQEQTSPVAAPPRPCQSHGALPMGFMCAPWEAAKPPCWVRIWGLLESMEADGSSFISKVQWSVLVCLAAGVKGLVEGPLSLLRNVGGVGMNRTLAFFIPCTFIHAYSSFCSFCCVQWLGLPKRQKGFFSHRWVRDIPT